MLANCKDFLLNVEHIFNHGFLVTNCVFCHQSFVVMMMHL